MRFDNDKKDPFTDLLDSIRNRTIKKSSAEANWNDVWLALITNYEYANVLRERGVEVGHLKNEIQFLDYFQKFELGETDLNYDQINLMQKALEELREDITHINDLYGGVSEASDLNEEMKNLLQIVHDKTMKMAIGRTAPSTKEESAVRLQIEMTKQALIKSAFDIAAPIVMRETMRDGERRIVGIDTLSGNTIEVDSNIEKVVLEAMEHEIRTYVANLIVQNDEGPAKLIADLEEAKGSKPTPAQIVDLVVAEAGQRFTQLLHRNGLRVTDPEYKDPLEGVLPHHEIQSLMSSAYEIALANNAKKLAPRHIALAIAQQTESHIHFHSLGIKDLVEFEEQVADRVQELDGKSEGHVSIHTQIPDEIYPLITRLNDLYKKEEDRLPLLLSLIRTDKEIDSAINKAGLTRAMLRDWPKKYSEEKNSEKKKKKTKSQKSKSGNFGLTSMFDSPRAKEGPYEIPDDYLDSLIKKYCIDYTRQAKEKKFDPMIGNQQTMETVLEILQKRGRKNPIVIGEPGTGKSKILEGLSMRIVKGQVPKFFFGARLLGLDLHQVNTSPFVGVFEERLLSILKGISERNRHGKLPPILLGLEELGETLDAGAHSSSPGFKGIVKPYLASGDLFTIGNATEDEYSQKIEKDPAIARRVQPVLQMPPTTDETTQILLGLKSRYSTHHKMRIPDGLLSYAAASASQYIFTVQQPDKSIDLLDSACAVARTVNAKTLTKEHINKALSAKSGIPVGFFNEGERERYASIDKQLSRQIFDQDEAVALVSAALKRAKAGIKDPGLPIGNFLFVGPTGVGKTEMMRAIARVLFGSDDEGFFNRFDMGEYMEKHSVAGMVGAPPGYVGHEQGSPIVNAVRRRPYCVNLFDEAEKADPAVFNFLLSPMSGGGMSDKSGKKADFSNTINGLTVNLGAQEVMETARKRGLDPFRDYEEWNAMAKPIYEHHVHSHFTPEFLNRFDGVLYFNLLRKDTLRKLVVGEFDRTASQVRAMHDIDLQIALAFREAVAEKGFDIRYGARPLKRAWNEIVGEPLADWLLRQSPLSLRRTEILEMLPEGQQAAATDSVVTSFRRPISKAKIDGELKPSFVARKAAGGPA